MSIRRTNPARIGRRLFIGASVAGGVSAPAIVSAQGEWPTRQIRVVIPYPPGGPSDVTTRLVMERAGSLLGQSVLFDNKAGASGAIGAEHVKNAAPDGYTFLTTTTAMVTSTRAEPRGLMAPFRPARAWRRARAETSQSATAAGASPRPGCVPATMSR